MLFNSIDFAIFHPVVFALYWVFVRNLKLQTWILLTSSYIFYGWWDWRFLSLLAFSSALDFFVVVINFLNERACFLHRAQLQPGSPA